MQREQRVLVLGGTGFLGSHFVDSLGGRAITHTTKAVNSETATNFRSIIFRKNKRQEVEAFLEKQNCETIINCIALADSEECESNTELAYWVNCELPGILSTVSKSLGSKFVHISTDAVFDGTASFRTEQDNPSPLSVYGKSKWDGEKLVLLNNPESIVARVNFFGRSNNKASLFDFFYESFNSEKIPIGFTDVYFTPLYTEHLVHAILELITLDARGLLHVVGSERISKFDFGVMVAEMFDLPDTFIRRGKMNGTPGATIRPLDLSLSNDKIKSLGVILPSVRDGLSILKKNMI